MMCSLLKYKIKRIGHHIIFEDILFYIWCYEMGPQTFWKSAKKDGGRGNNKSDKFLSFIVQQFLALKRRYTLLLIINV